MARGRKTQRVFRLITERHQLPRLEVCRATSFHANQARGQTSDEPANPSTTKAAVDNWSAPIEWSSMNVNGLYVSKVNGLRKAFNEDGAREEAAQILRGLVDEIRPHPIDGQL